MHKTKTWPVVSIAACLAVAPYLMCLGVLAAERAAYSDSLEEANRLFAQHEYDQAAGAFRLILAGTPDVATKGKAQFNLGLSYRAMKKATEAITVFRELLASKVDDKEPGGELMITNRNYRYLACLNIAGCYEETGNARKALEFALLAKDKYHFVTWCGTCAAEEGGRLDAYITKLTKAAGGAKPATQVPSIAMIQHLPPPIRTESGHAAAGHDVPVARTSRGGLAAGIGLLTLVAASVFWWTRRRQRHRPKLWG
jgi:tetratricopeptide (TPR) repeat protein